MQTIRKEQAGTGTGAIVCSREYDDGTVVSETYDRNVSSTFLRSDGRTTRSVAIFGVVSVTESAGSVYYHHEDGTVTIVTLHK